MSDRRPSRRQAGPRPARVVSTVIYGRNAVDEALLGRRAAAVREIWATEGARREPFLAGRQLKIVSAAEIADRCGSQAHQGVCAEAGPYPYADAQQLLKEESPLIVVLDHVQDPQNLGAICRTSECVGASGVVIHERGSAGVTPAVCKASAGAVEHVRVAQVRNIADFIADARRAGVWCYGAAARGAQSGRLETVSYDTPDYSGAVALVLGSEGEGLRPRVAAACDELICLPLRGKIESLSVSAAAAALLYRILQDRPPARDLSTEP